MTGLENILSQINEDAQREAGEKIAAAKAEADEILKAAGEDAARISQTMIQDGEKAAQDIRDRAESAALLERRNAMLSFKQQLICKAIDNTRAALENAPEQEYFDLLLRLVSKSAVAGKAEMRLNRRDLDRLPADFAAALKQAAPQADITVSPAPCDIESGFLLAYGGIDINCTFRAIFEDAESELRDAAGNTLFSGI